MPAEDTRPAEEPSRSGNGGNGDDASPNMIREWWKKRSGLEKILICAGIVIAVAVAWHFRSQHENSNREADIGSEVKTSMQQTFDTDQQFAQYHLSVSKVDVMHKSGNEYEGPAVVTAPKMSITMSQSTSPPKATA